MNKLFSVTTSDFEFSYTKGTGAGGQKRNKTSSAVHCKHIASGAQGYSESSRSQHDNKRDAFLKVVNSTVFQTWLKLETMKRTGESLEIERAVENDLTKIRVEGKIDGKWVEVNPDTFEPI